MNKLIISIAFFLSLTAGVLLAQDTDFDKSYYPLEFEKILSYFKQINDTSQVKENYFIGRYRFCINYIGEKREISAEKLSFMRKMMNHHKVNENFQKMYAYELAFNHQGTTYWIPVQNVVMPHFEKELNKGDEVYLYAVFMGYSEQNQESKWLMLNTEFKSNYCKNGIVAVDNGYNIIEFSEMLKAFTDEETYPSTEKEVFKANQLCFCLEYLGDTQKINKERKSLINNSLKYLKQDSKLIEQYNIEISFLYQGEKYWIPVQDIVLPYFAKELKKGDKVFLYGLSMINWKKGKSKQWVFINTDFNSKKCN